METNEDSCKGDERYEAMLTASWGVIGLVCSYGLLLLILVSLQGFKCIRAYRRSQKPAPDNLSSDEEDDREFKREF